MIPKSLTVVARGLGKADWSPLRAAGVVTPYATTSRDVDVGGGGGGGGGGHGGGGDRLSDRCEISWRNYILEELRKARFGFWG